MADATINILRKEAFAKRVKGPIGGLHIAWSTKDLARIADHVGSVSERTLRESPTLASSRPTAPTIRSEMGPSDRDFLFVITTEDVDLSGDVVKRDGIISVNFSKNPTVLDTHNSMTLPIAVSTVPQRSTGTSTTAIARFPQPGINQDSDRIAAAIRAGLVRGASISFIPLKWSFTKNPARPLGVDFEAVQLLEWSICAQPCNQSALLITSVSGDAKGIRSSHRVDDRGSRSLHRVDDRLPLTRSERIAEARALRASVAPWLRT